MSTPNPVATSEVGLRNSAFVRLVTVLALNGTASAVSATLVLFFIEDRLRVPMRWQGLFLGLHFLSAALFMPLWLRVGSHYHGWQRWATRRAGATPAPLHVLTAVKCLLPCALKALAAGVCLSLAACSGPKVADYAGQKPVLNLRDYFNGTLDAYGIFTDRSGSVVKRFTVVMECRWQGNEGVLDEAFTYSDGTTQRRIWRLTEMKGGRFVGRADDVVGQAQGEQSGNAFQWGYTLALPVDGRVIEVQFDDWMFFMDERVMLNRAAMSKWGVHLGDVTLSFIKRRT